MIVTENSDALKDQVRAWKQQQQRVIFVPTMGNLHAGHLSLITKAKTLGQRCVVSIFVNPTQFGANEDFATYPRTLEQDQALLAEAQVDLLFFPEVTTVYPRSPAAATYVEVPGLSDLFCGKTRPGHFRGVSTVVCILLNLVQPDAAVFGEKDYQQLLVIRRMVSDLAIPVDIISAPTLRAEDGLALSSRNGYLTSSERTIAPRLYQVLSGVKQRLSAGDQDFTGLEQQAVNELTGAGFVVDYVAIRNAADLSTPIKTESKVVLAAAYLGTCRLIDNIAID